MSSGFATGKELYGARHVAAWQSFTRFYAARGNEKFHLSPSSGTEQLRNAVNYRTNLRSLLKGVRFEGADNIDFEEVEFLPEPFAVFQYYRHGVRHEAIQQRRKYCALVVDFGGGTFDVCVIETTHEGEISYGGITRCGCCLT